MHYDEVAYRQSWSVDVRDYLFYCGQEGVLRAAVDVPNVIAKDTIFNVCRCH